MGASASADGDGGAYVVTTFDVIALAALLYVVRSLLGYARNRFDRPQIAKKAQ